MIVASSYIAPISKCILSIFLVVETSPFSNCTEKFTLPQSKRECSCMCNQTLISLDALRSAVQPPLEKRERYRPETHAPKRKKRSKTCPAVRPENHRLYARYSAVHLNDSAVRYLPNRNTPLMWEEKEASCMPKRLRVTGRSIAIRIEDRIEIPSKYDR